MPGTVVPPFPDDVPTVPLLVIDFELIKAGDKTEIDRLWKAATELGFWYLRNHGVEEEVAGMFDTGAEVMALPLSEKMAFEQGDSGVSFGYKVPGANATDEYGSLDLIEFINVAKDDVLAYPTTVHRTYPDAIYARMENTLKPFVLKSLEVNNTLLAVLNDRLGLPPGTLAKRHTNDEWSASEARMLRNPGKQDVPQDKAALGAHTDFGTITFVHQMMLGGLQVLLPNSDQWVYVKPVPGHAICNIGDALTVFSAGILRSNLHRVVAPPKQQAGIDRYSVVFFTRPGHGQVLAPLSDESPLIAEAAARAGNKFSTGGSTAKEWFTRRVKNQRIANRQGPETWRASRGTEDRPQAY